MNDGGPAFPGFKEKNDNFTGEEKNVPYEGMSLRDWFAGMSLMGIQAACNQQTRELLLNQGNPTEMFAISAYAMADMMLAKR